MREVFVEEHIDEAAGMLALAEKKLRAFRSLDPVTRRRRLFGFLQRRGFGTAAVLATLDKVLGR